MAPKVFWAFSFFVFVFVQYINNHSFGGLFTGDLSYPAIQFLRSVLGFEEEKLNLLFPDLDL